MAWYVTVDRPFGSHRANAPLGRVQALSLPMKNLAEPHGDIAVQ